MTSNYELLTDPKYKHYLAQYSGDIVNEVKSLKDTYVTIINSSFAVISFPSEVHAYSEVRSIKSVVYLNPLTLYSLLDISPLDAANIPSLQQNLPLNLSGNGVTVVVIDTGVDYLNPCFMDKDGNTRIKLIWDQTVASTESSLNKEENKKLPFGSIYFSENINAAIALKREGKDPYSIVPSKDEISHGTSLSAIIGGRFPDGQYQSVAPNCSFIVIKLLQDESIKKRFKLTAPVYNIFSVVAAFDFLSKYIQRYPFPTVIFLPLGSNLGSHTSFGVLDTIIDDISLNKGIVVVTGAGNEGNAEGHTSGYITKKGDYKDIQLYVDSAQEYLKMEIWVSKPNLMSLTVISPSGESTGDIAAKLNSSEAHVFVFEKTQLFVNYFIPEKYTGDEMILIILYSLQPGTWKFRLNANYVLDGKYDAWIPQKGITIGKTRFISSDPYGTSTNPSSSTFIVTAANYNQNNNNIVNSSGMSLLDSIGSTIDVAAGGVNVKTIDSSGNTVFKNGSSVSAAVVAGCCALLLEWGIIDGNDPSMYSEKLKTYLVRGTKKRPGDIYPNAEWGYGILDMIGVFENI